MLQYREHDRGTALTRPGALPIASNSSTIVAHMRRGAHLSLHGHYFVGDSIATATMRAVWVGGEAASWRVSRLVMATLAGSRATFRRDKENAT
jgi:hypothetical protein